MVIYKITKPKRNPNHNKTEWSHDTDSGFLDNLFENIGRQKVDQTVNKMMDEDPKFGEFVKDMRQRQKETEDRLKKEQEERDSYVDGLNTLKYPNGKVKKIFMFNKELDKWADGPMTIYYDNGQVRTKKTIKDGMTQGVSISYHKNGQKWSEGEYNVGGREGLHTHWYENGQKKAEMHFQKFKPDTKKYSYLKNCGMKMEL